MLRDEERVTSEPHEQAATHVRRFALHVACARQLAPRCERRARIEGPTSKRIGRVLAMNRE